MNTKTVVRLVAIAAGAWAAAVPTARAQVMGEPAARPRVVRQQPKGQSASPGATSHLEVVLRASRDGRVEVVRATELPGEPVLADAVVGKYAYEVTREGKAVAAEGVIDPFELRAFPGPKGSGFEGHHFQPADSALIVVKIPGATLADAARQGLAVRLYRVQSEHRLEKLDVGEVARLKSGGELKLEWEVSGLELSQAVHDQGRKL
jgi:hypothetical protein